VTYSKFTKKQRTLGFVKKKKEKKKDPRLLKEVGDLNLSKFVS